MQVALLKLQTHVAATVQTAVAFDSQLRGVEDKRINKQTNQGTHQLPLSSSSIIMLKLSSAIKAGVVGLLACSSLAGSFVTRALCAAPLVVSVWYVPQSNACTSVARKSVRVCVLHALHWSTGHCAAGLPDAKPPAA